MEPWHSEYAKTDDKIVDAIEEGKIVRVLESYAKSEGLPILRKTEIKQDDRYLVKGSQKVKGRGYNVNSKDDKKQTPSFEDLRKPLKPNQVVSELIDNFNWEISKKRRQLSLTRKQLASSINVIEENLKLIENGIIPENDFKIINKIQDRLQINLRKDQKDYTQSPRKLLNKEGKSEDGKKIANVNIKSNQASDEIIVGEDIEILGEED